MPLTAVYCLVEVSYVLKCLLALALLKKERWLNNLTQPEVSQKEMSASKREIENGDPAVPQTNRIEALEESPGCSNSENLAALIEFFFFYSESAAQKKE